MFRIAASLLWQPATGFVGTQFRLVHREPRARQALVTNHRMCQHNKPRACMHIIASLKGFRLQTHADEGMPVASRAVQVRIYRCTHDHDSQLAHALAPAVKVCRRSDMMQINASCQSCAKRPSARCPVAGSPSHRFARIARSATAPAASPPSQRACVPHTLHALCPCVSACIQPVEHRGLDTRARHSARPTWIAKQCDSGYFGRGRGSQYGARAGRAWCAVELTHVWFQRTNARHRGRRVVVPSAGYSCAQWRTSHGALRTAVGTSHDSLAKTAPKLFALGALQGALQCWEDWQPRESDAGRLQACTCLRTRATGYRNS